LLLNHPHSLAKYASAARTGTHRHAPHQTNNAFRWGKALFVFLEPIKALELTQGSGAAMGMGASLELDRALGGLMGFHPDANPATRLCLRRALGFLGSLGH